MKDPGTILIGYDGSDCANAAIDDLTRAGLPATVNATLLSVAEVWAPQPSLAELDNPLVSVEGVEMAEPVIHARTSKALEEAWGLARQGAERLQSHFPSWRLDTRVLAESPAWGLLMVADELAPDLVVVGSHGRSAVGRLILGSVSQKVLYECRSSVRIARHHEMIPGSPVRIVVGVDATPDSEAAVAEIASRQWPAGSAVQIIAAIGPIDIGLVPPVGATVPISIAEALEQQQSWFEKAIASATEVLSRSGLIVSGGIREVPPIPAILDEAKEWGADVIFLGAKGHRFMERFLLGSVSASVAARAHCSVEVVRRS